VDHAVTAPDTALLLYLDSDELLSLAADAARAALAGAQPEAAAREALTLHLERRSQSLLATEQYSDDPRVWRNATREAGRLRDYAGRLRRVGYGA